MHSDHRYDTVIAGAGHNGLIAACYLALAGQRVLILEKNDAVGGATCSKHIFPGVDARVSVYSYLVSLLPAKIITDLGIRFETRQRRIASYTPVEQNGRMSGLLVSNQDEEVTRQSFAALTGSDREYRRYAALQEKLARFARQVWPTLLSPLPSKAELRARFQTAEDRRTWDYLVEKPLAALIEDHLNDDTVRGVVFTDAKIGVLTHPDDPSLLQNRTFLYHIVGQGTGEWRVPVSGMGALIDALTARARGLGVEIRTSAEVRAVEPGSPLHTVHYANAGVDQAVRARYVLFNTASNIANQILPGACQEEQVEGSVFKINMVLRRLPELRGSQVSPQDAFSGTFHLYEGYQEMKDSYHNALAGRLPEPIPGEMYCHSLTDPSILAPALQEKGFHTLTLFGLDLPYTLFGSENAARRAEITARYLQAIDHFIDGSIADCLALDADGNPCLEAKTPLDLENALGLPKGNIFHGNLTWPFAETNEQAGTWGVETAFENVLICGSSAKRGGAVSGIPGHNAAMKVLGQKG